MDIDRLPFPAPSRQSIAGVQAARKRLAVERAKRSPFYQGRLDHIDLERLDEPAEWARIPVLTKDELRLIPAEEFHRRFAIVPESAAVDYWRSGGSTGQPLFYARSAEDLHAALEGYRRVLLAAGCVPGDKLHMSMPVGIHPAGRMLARAAEAFGIGTIWAGSGNNTPSEMQLELIRCLEPTVWLGMPSYGQQLAALADARGIDLAKGSVRRIICAAEHLSTAKRAKLEQLWGAEIYDHFGAAEGGPMGVESERHDGLHLFTDLFFFEVLDEASGMPVAAGEPGVLVMTPLYTNATTPFLRWNMGDVGTLVEDGATTGLLSVYPIFRHAGRTTGFFKVRGVNINHADFEDFMHRQAAVMDFRAEALDTATLDILKVQIELRRDYDPAEEMARLAQRIRASYEISPEIEMLETGTLARLFATDLKARRFVDSRRR